MLKQIVCGDVMVIEIEPHSLMLVTTAEHLIRLVTKFEHAFVSLPIVSYNVLPFVSTYLVLNRWDGLEQREGVR